MSDYRSEVESLRAENERLTARVAELEAKPMVEKVPTRWVVQWKKAGDLAGFFAFCGSAIAVGYVLFSMRSYVIDARIPFSAPIERRGLLVFSILVLAWCLAFVRRVPR
jgi:hypothetical protein